MPRRTAPPAARCCGAHAAEEQLERPAASSSAIARPMPRFAPVTSAVSPLKSIGAESLLHYIRAGRGEPIILIHPLGAELVVWEPVIELLGAERDVIALDMPGFGASPPSRMTRRPSRRRSPPASGASWTGSAWSARTWPATRWGVGGARTGKNPPCAVGDRALARPGSGAALWASVADPTYERSPTCFRPGCRRSRGRAGAGDCCCVGPSAIQSASHRPLPPAWCGRTRGRSRTRAPTRPCVRRSSTARSRSRCR